MYFTLVFTASHDTYKQCISASVKSGMNSTESCRDSADCPDVDISLRPSGLCVWGGGGCDWATGHTDKEGGRGRGEVCPTAGTTIPLPGEPRLVQAGTLESTTASSDEAVSPDGARIKQ